MMNAYAVLMAFTKWMWSLPVLLILIGGGLCLTAACDFVQIRHFGYMIKKTYRCAVKKEQGKISGVQAMLATLACTIGTGNIVGVGSAIALGGPGAIFWMWGIGFVAMALKYSEAVLGVATRIKDENGQWKGGANRYLALVWKPLGLIWALACVTARSIACGIHTGAIVDAAKTFHIPGSATTIISTIIILVVMLGGMKVLVKVTDRLVPIMGVIYILLGCVVIALNADSIVPAFLSIFSHAFTGTAETGGFAGAAIATTIRTGCARGVFSNDGGNGGSSIFHSRADVTEPVEQGMYAIFEVFVDTIVVCTFTALVVLCTGVWTSGDPGSKLAINTFSTIGTAGHLVSVFTLILFAGSTILSLATSAGILANDIFGRYFMHLMQFLVLAFCLLGGTVGVDAALPWIDVANMILITFNVGGTLFLMKKLRALTLDYIERIKD